MPGRPPRYPESSGDRFPPYKESDELKALHEEQNALFYDTPFDIKKYEEVESRIQKQYKKDDDQYEKAKQKFIDDRKAARNRASAHIRTYGIAGSKRSKSKSKTKGGGCGCSLRGGYRATRKNRVYLRRWQQGKSIGFTMRSSLKAKGLIPRANGRRFVSAKYA